MPRVNLFPRRTVLLAALASPAARAQCRIGPSATVPLHSVEGFPIVQARIGGQPVSFLLDTGAQGHLLLPEAEAALRLPLLPGTVPLIGTGGAREAPLALLAGVELGAVALAPTPTPIAPLPAAIPSVTPPLAGLLGAPLLQQFDLELDAKAGTLALTSAGLCDPPPGTDPIRLDITPDRQATLPVQINGVALTALLDTGSRATLLSLETARRLGLDAPVSANTAQGIDGERLPVAHGRVREFAVGSDVRHNAPVSIAPIRLSGADLLLGFDYLRQRRVWISYVSATVAIGGRDPLPSAPRSPPPPPPGRRRP